MRSLLLVVVTNAKKVTSFPHRYLPLTTGKAGSGSPVNFFVTDRDRTTTS
jgi:hypothetical protein